jgi:hypothetical protein
MILQTYAKAIDKDTRECDPQAECVEVCAAESSGTFSSYREVFKLD